MGERHYNSDVFSPWDLETARNTPFITQVHHLVNLHTPLGRDLDRTSSQGADKRVRRLGRNG